MPDNAAPVIGDYMRGGDSATIGVITDLDEPERDIKLRIITDNYAGDLKVQFALKLPNGKTKTQQLYFGGVTRGADAAGLVRHVEEYLNTDLPQGSKGWKVELLPLKAPKVKKPKAPALTGALAEQKQKLDQLEKLRFKTYPQEQQIKRIRLILAADPAKWAAGMGVGWRVTSDQINRGYRIVDVIPEEKRADIVQIADTGLTRTGGDDPLTGEAHRVWLADLLRDKKYDAPETTAGPGAGDYERLREHLEAPPPTRLPNLTAREQLRIASSPEAQSVPAPLDVILPPRIEGTGPDLLGRLQEFVEHAIPPQYRPVAADAAARLVWPALIEGVYRTAEQHPHDPPHEPRPRHRVGMTEEEAQALNDVLTVLRGRVSRGQGPGASEIGMQDWDYLLQDHLKVVIRHAGRIGVPEGPVHFQARAALWAGEAVVRRRSVSSTGAHSQDLAHTLRAAVASVAFEQWYAPRVGRATASAEIEVPEARQEEAWRRAQRFIREWWALYRARVAMNPVVLTLAHLGRLSHLLSLEDAAGLLGLAARKVRHIRAPGGYTVNQLLTPDEHKQIHAAIDAWLDRRDWRPGEQLGEWVCLIVRDFRDADWDPRTWVALSAACLISRLNRGPGFYTPAAFFHAMQAALRAAVTQEPRLDTESRARSAGSFRELSASEVAWLRQFWAEALQHFGAGSRLKLLSEMEHGPVRPLVVDGPNPEAEYDRLVEHLHRPRQRVLDDLAQRELLHPHTSPDTQAWSPPGEFLFRYDPTGTFRSNLERYVAHVVPPALSRVAIESALGLHWHHVPQAIRELLDLSADAERRIAGQPTIGERQARLAKWLEGDRPDYSRWTWYQQDDLWRLAIEMGRRALAEGRTQNPISPAVTRALWIGKTASAAHTALAGEGTRTAPERQLASVLLGLIASDVPVTPFLPGEGPPTDVPESFRWLGTEPGPLRDHALRVLRAWWARYTSRAAVASIYTTAHLNQLARDLPTHTLALGAALAARMVLDEEEPPDGYLTRPVLTKDDLATFRAALDRWLDHGDREPARAVSTRACALLQSAGGWAGRETFARPGIDPRYRVLLSALCLLGLPDAARPTHTRRQGRRPHRQAPRPSLSPMALFGQTLHAALRAAVTKERQDLVGWSAEQNDPLTPSALGWVRRWWTEFVRREPVSDVASLWELSSAPPTVEGPRVARTLAGEIPPGAFEPAPLPPGKQRHQLTRDEMIRAVNQLLEGKPAGSGRWQTGPQGTLWPIPLLKIEDVLTDRAILEGEIAAIELVADLVPELDFLEGPMSAFANLYQLWLVADQRPRDRVVRYFRMESDRLAALTSYHKEVSPGSHEARLLYASSRVADDMANVLEGKRPQALMDVVQDTMVGAALALRFDSAEQFLDAWWAKLQERLDPWSTTLQGPRS